MKLRDEDALEYHAAAPAGKIAIRATKPCLTQRDLSLAYTLGVAVPCLAIERDPSLTYKYTAIGNLVAVVTNGTAVLGLGNIGPLAAKPVMEGKVINPPGKQLASMPAIHGCGSCRIQSSSAPRVAAIVLSWIIVPSAWSTQRLMLFLCMSRPM